MYSRASSENWGIQRRRFESPKTRTLFLGRKKDQFKALSLGQVEEVSACIQLEKTCVFKTRLSSFVERVGKNFCPSFCWHFHSSFRKKCRPQNYLCLVNRHRSTLFSTLICFRIFFLFPKGPPSIF